MYIPTALDCIVDEVLKAEAKWPNWPGDLRDGVLIMAEEAGEAIKALNDMGQRKATMADLIHEVTQTGAMAVRLLSYLLQLEEALAAVRVPRVGKHKPITCFRGDFRFLSNFWPVEVMLNMDKYASVEHAYQAAKFPKGKWRASIRACKTPGEAKRLARDNRTFWRKEWDAGEKLVVMKHLLLQKFEGPEMRAWLASTYPRRLEEGNSWGDTYWGVDLKTGKGTNMLGEMLMEIRLKILERAWE